MAHTFLANPEGHGGAGPGFQVMVHVGQDPLAADGVFAATLEDGTHLSAEALRRVTCDSGMVAVSVTGQELTVGRRTRSIPTAMRRALMLRDHGCRFPGCTHHQFLHGHHIQHWLHGGESSLDNLVMLCSHHHHLVHEGGFALTWSAEGQLIFSAPHGHTRSLLPLSLFTDRISCTSVCNGLLAIQPLNSQQSRRRHSLTHAIEAGVPEKWIVQLVYRSMAVGKGSSGYVRSRL